MFLQFSPPVRQKEAPKADKKENEEIVYLTLEPFGQKPKIIFENITVGSNAARSLVIKNPSRNGVSVTIDTSDLPEERQLQLDWMTNIIEKQDEVLLILTWSPIEPGSWLHTFRVQYGLKKMASVTVVLKSVLPENKNRGKKQQKTKSKKLPSFVSKKSSPVHGGLLKSKSPEKRILLPENQNYRLLINQPISRGGKENNFITENYGSNDRRETFILQPAKSDDSLKNVIKNSFHMNLTPDTSIEKKLQIFRFSPVAATGEAIENKSKILDFQFNPKPVEIVESKTINFEYPEDYLQSLSTCSTPNIQFSPPICSTDEKSVDDTNRYHGKQKSLFNNSSRDQANISTETYIKHNLSTETYTKGNLSSDTSTKFNLSSDTFSKEAPSPRDSLETIEVPKSSPLFPKMNEEFWGGNNFGVKKQLIPIEEESFFDTSVCLKRKLDRIFDATPSKRPNLGGGSERISDWSKRSKKFNKSSAIGESINITNTASIEIKNLFLLSISDVDPFVLSSYLDNIEFFNQLENDFKKYLNALLIPSMFREKEQDGFSLNVEKLLKNCQSHSSDQEMTVKNQKNKSQTDLRLISFRKKALHLYRSDEMQAVIRKINLCIDKDKLRIRDDKDLHLNLTLQTEIISIILSYNPVWLKIVFEIIFGKSAHFQSNSELTSYLLENFFKNQLLLKRYKSIHSIKYKIYIKKFMLKKFLLLVYFLDQAKIKRIISHNPCLFRRNAPIKDSREALLKFSRETLFGLGDITKQLKYNGYTVSHKQTYIDEFDYTVKCLGVDLRDGVRLTRLLEILTLETKMTKNLRVPAISRLQKVHNTKIVFDVLNESNFQILYNITPEDLVDGHREKTLSFLWQIFYKFQAPLMVKNATIIQKWWRCDAIIQKRNNLKNNWLRKNSAASKIQKWYKNQQFVRKLNHFISMGKLYALYNAKNRAAVVIQKNIRMFVAKQKYQRLRKMVINLQINIRQWLLKHDYEKKRLSAIIIQRRYRAILKMRINRSEFLQKKWAVITIQNWFRRLRLAKAERIKFLAYKTTALIIQRQFRAYKVGKTQKSYYISLRNSCIVIQRRFRALQQMKGIREEYLNHRWAALVIQQKYRAYRVGKVQRIEFCALRQSALIIQRKYRATIEMRQQFNYYTSLKNSAISIQRLYRANRARNQAVIEYNHLRESTIIIQIHFRAWKSMITAYRYFIKLKWAAIVFQRKYRATIEMRQQFNYYTSLKNSAISVQRLYRANRARNQAVIEYNHLRKSTIIIQIHYRAWKSMITAYRYFIKLKWAAIVFQRKYRARQARNQFQSIRNVTIFLQNQYRAKRLMRRELHYYQKLKHSTILIQRLFRAKIISRRIRQDYVNLQNATTILQRKFRARREMKRYNKLKQAAIVIQQKFRAKQLSSLKRNEFIVKRNACATIQRHFRAYIIMKKQFIIYNQLKQAIICIQTRFRAKILAKTQRENYLILRKTTIFVQKHIRNNKLAITARINYTNLRVSVIKIQRWYRSIKKMEETRFVYHRMKAAAIKIEAVYRGWIQRGKYLAMQQTVIFIQRKYRSIKLMEKERKYFLKLQKSVRIVQERWRGKLLMRKVQFDFEKKLLIRRDLLRKIKAAVKIQAFWRGYRTRSKQSELKEIRKRLQEVMDKSDVEETLAKRYEKSFRRLSDEKCTLLEVLKELENIDFITRRCKDLCIRMSASLPAAMFVVLAATGRSDPEIGINTAAANVLINFCKYDLTLSACWLPNEMYKVLNLMLHFCDKEYNLFPTLCTFLWLLAHNDEYKQGIKNIEGFARIMSKIEAQCLRKEKMVKNSTKRHSLFAQYKTLPLPSLTSDWGLLYTQKLYSFKNSRQAFDELKRILL